MFRFILLWNFLDFSWFLLEFLPEVFFGENFFTTILDFVLKTSDFYLSERIFESEHANSSHMWHTRSSWEQDGEFVKSRVDRRGAARRQEEERRRGGGSGGEVGCGSRAQHKAQRCSPVDPRTLYKQGHFATGCCKKFANEWSFCVFGQRTKQWKRGIWEEGSGCKTAMVSFWRIRTQQTVQIAKVYGLVQNNEKNITKLFCARYAFVLPHNVTSEMSNLSFWPEQNRSPIR